MPRKTFRLILLTSLAVAVLPKVCLAQASPENSLKSGLHLENYKTLTYHAQDGRTISASQFMSLVSAGQSFSIAKDEEKSIASLSINPKVPVSTKEQASGQSNVTLNVAVGEAVPSTLLAGLFAASGNRDQFASRPVLLNFFFHDCLPCIQEVGALNKFHESTKAVSVLAVTFESSGQAAKFTSKYGFGWPVAANSQDFINQLGVKAYPTLVLLSGNGTLLAARTGDLRSASNDMDPLRTLQGWVRTSLQK